MPRKKTTKSFFVEISKGVNNAEVSSREVELPEMENSSVLVQVKACALNNVKAVDELSISQILKKSAKIQCLSAAFDVAGVVVAVGKDVVSFTEGDHVVGILPMDYDQSGCSEFIMFQEFDIVLIPENVTFVDAAACIGDAVKAYIGLHYLGRLKSGDTVLVLQGASSFGSICIQLAHHWGTKVLTTSSSENENLYLQKLEPEICHVIEMNQNASLKSVVMLETGNLGIDIIVDQGITQFPQNIGNNDQDNKLLSCLPSKHEIISCLAVGGRWVSSKSNLQLDPPNSRLLYLRCASVGFLLNRHGCYRALNKGSINIS